jgi:hypothetical protein
MKLHTVLIQVCDACLRSHDRQCAEPGCRYASAPLAQPREDAALLQIDGWAMCCACHQHRASRVTKAGTMEERQYCQHCWGIEDVRVEWHALRGMN